MFYFRVVQKGTKLKQNVLSRIHVDDFEDE